MPDASQHIERGRLGLQTREVPITGADAEKRTATLVWTTGAKVRRYDWERGRAYNEELSLNPSHVRMERLQSGAAPLLNNHRAWDGLNGVLGVVDRAALAPEPLADVRFSSREEVAPIVRDVAEKIIRNVSVGYIVHRYEMQPPDGADINGVWSYRAVDWEPYELSLVTVPADAGAQVRASADGQPSVQERMFDCEFFTPAAAAAAADFYQRNNKEPSMSEKDTPTAPAADSHAGTEQQRAAGAAAATPNAPPAADNAGLAQVLRAATSAGLDMDWVTARLVENKTHDQIRAAIIEHLASRADAVPTRRTDIHVVSDETVNVRAQIVQALLHRYSPGQYSLDDGARQYRGYSLMELARERLEAKGISTRGMSKLQICERTFQGGSDLPNIVLDAANKTLRAGYESVVRSFVPFCRRAVATDFKNINRVQLSGAPSLLLNRPGEEIKRGNVSDGKETYALATYARITGIDRQTLINDDLSAFTRIPELMARAAADLETDTVYSIITTNGAMADGGNLFNATATTTAGGHANLTSTGTAISVTSLDVGRAAMRVQKGLEGRPINVAPQFLLVPAAKETVAQQYTSADFVSAKSSDINPFKSRLQVITEPRLDAASAVSWYLVADPAQIDTIEYAYLEGADGVYLETRQGWDVDGVEMKVRLDFAAKAIDWRGMYKNNGA